MNRECVTHAGVEITRSTFDRWCCGCHATSSQADMRDLHRGAI